MDPEKIIFASVTVAITLAVIALYRKGSYDSSQAGTFRHSPFLPIIGMVGILLGIFIALMPFLFEVHPVPREYYTTIAVGSIFILMGLYLVLLYRLEFVEMRDGSIVVHRLGNPPQTLDQGQIVAVRKLPHKNKTGIRLANGEEVAISRWLKGEPVLRASLEALASRNAKPDQH